MIKPSIAILLALYTSNAMASFGGHIVGNHDDRVYASVSNPEYRGLVRLTANRGGVCSGTFVSKNLILTNSHCAVACKNGCSAYFYNESGNEKSNLKVVAYYPNYDIFNGTDWALMLSDKDSSFHRSITPQTTTGPILSGGYGMMRILKDEEIPTLKQLYAQTKQEFKEKCLRESKNNSNAWIGCINKHFETKVQERGIEPIFRDSGNFKVQNCKILGTMQGHDKMIYTDCDAAAGNSGGPYLRGGQIVGLNNCGFNDIFDEKSAGAGGLKTENFYNSVQKYVKKYSGTAAFDNNNTTNNTNNQNNQTNLHTHPVSNPNNQTNNTNNTNNNNSSSNQNNQNQNNQNQNQNNNNTNNNQNNETPDVIDDPQKIEQILEQRIMDFDCD